MNRTSFLAGRDLAVQMLRESEAIELAADDRSSIEAQYREGPQENYVLRYLEVLLRRPELAAGFAAVLSDFFPAGGSPDPEVYERLTIEQMLGAQH
jgi:hypothetical protein